MMPGTDRLALHDEVKNSTTTLRNVNLQHRLGWKVHFSAAHACGHAQVFCGATLYSTTELTLHLNSNSIFTAHLLSRVPV